MDVDNRRDVSLYNIHDQFAVAVHKEHSLVWPNPLSYRAFIACSISAHTRPLKLPRLQL